MEGVTGISPLGPGAIPTASKPSPSVFARRPVATRIRSAETTSARPSFSKWTSTRPSDRSTRVIRTPVWKTMPSSSR